MIKIIFCCPDNVNMTSLHDMLVQMSQKLDKTVEDLKESKQRQLETEKELNATRLDTQCTKWSDVRYKLFNIKVKFHFEYLHYKHTIWMQDSGGI